MDAPRPLTAAELPTLTAPPGWRAVDLLSDLHLQASEPLTFESWRHWMANTEADAVFILGDLFEVWVGDDLRDPFSDACRAALADAARHRTVGFMAGNRDFLVGPELLGETGLRRLDDPTVLAFQGRRWLLSHGDALCLGDRDYQAFRTEVRTPAWRQAFLARPLAERQAVARGLRDASEARKRSDAVYAEPDADLARSWLRAANAGTLIHGHTHRPGEEPLGDGLRRVVLSDWDAAARPPRLEVLRLDEQGLRRIDLAPPP